MKISHIAIVSILCVSLFSCSSNKNNLAYFQEIDTENFSANINTLALEPKIEPYDELNITVNSLQPELSAQYNLPLTNPITSKDGFVTYTTPTQATYIVTGDGDITMPVLGKIHVAGMTTDQLSKFLVEKISAEVADPIVIVNLLNFKINVAGEVIKPGQYNMKDKRVSVLDALSAAGDLTPYGERSNILLIREENGKRVAYTFDLTNPDILSSPNFYLKQNDYIYVAPNKIRNDNAKYNQNNAFKLSVISTVVSAVSVVASLVIALAIR